MIEDQIVEFETARLAKQKGFSGYISNKWYYKNGALYTSQESRDWNEWEYTEGIRWTACSQEVLRKWIREVHGIHITIIPTCTCFWTYITVNIITSDTNLEVSQEPPYKEVSGYDYSIYEDALEEALKESLSIIK